MVAIVSQGVLDRISEAIEKQIKENTDDVDLYRATHRKLEKLDGMKITQKKFANELEKLGLANMSRSYGKLYIGRFFLGGLGDEFSILKFEDMNTRAYRGAMDRIAKLTALSIEDVAEKSLEAVQAVEKLAELRDTLQAIDRDVLRASMFGDMGKSESIRAGSTMSLISNLYS